MPRRAPRIIGYLTWKRIALLALSSLLLLGLAIGARILVAVPLKGGDVYFENPSTVMAGPGGLLLVGDSGDRRLLGIDAEGRLRFLIPGGRRFGGFYNGRVVGFDRAGDFYLDDSILDADSGNTERERIYRYSERGRRLGVAHEEAYAAAAKTDVTKVLIYVQAAPGYLAWFFPKGTDPSGLGSVPAPQGSVPASVGSVPAPQGSVPAPQGSDPAAEVDWLLHVLPEGGEELPPRGFEGYDVYGTVDVALASPDEVFFLERSGRIARRVGTSGLVQPWFDNAEELLRFPVALATGPGGELYVLDGKRAIYRIAEEGGTPRALPLLDRQRARQSGYDRPLALSNIAVGPDGRIWSANEATGEVIGASPDGSVKVLGGARVTGLFLAYRIAVALAFLVAALGLAASVAAYNLKVFASRSRLLLKQLSVLVPLTAIAVFAIAWGVYSYMAGRVEEDQRERLDHLAQLTAARLPVEALDRIDPSRSKLDDILGSEDYKALAAVFDEVVNRNEDPWDAKLFPYAYIWREGDWFIVGGFDYVELYPAAYYKPAFSRVLDLGERVTYRYSDLYGSWLSSLRPLARPDGSIAAVVEASLSGDLAAEHSRSALLRISIGTVILLILLVGAFTAFDAALLRSVNALREGAERVAGGDYGGEVAIATRDEIEALGEAFNAMSRRIKAYVEELALLGEANARFVPKEFLAQLGRKSITEIGLGDQVFTEMTILFSDIRSFTTLSEGLSPGDTMDLLNRYLARMGPAVRASGGFIDKYIGDAIMALFPGKADDAADAVLGMMSELDAFRAELAAKGEKSFDAGFGLHTGGLMLGVIGEEERYESTVIADAVNLASRLESLTKFYGVRAVISGSVLNRLRNKERPARFLDLVRVKGRRDPVSIYELVGPGDLAGAAKLGAAEEYRRAFAYYRAGRFNEATVLYRRILLDAPGDNPARLMFERSRAYATAGAPKGWDGVTVFHEK